jgi:hypothetical protein
MSVQLPEDLRFPLYRERNRKDPAMKLHEIGDNRETRRREAVSK